MASVALGIKQSSHVVSATYNEDDMTLTVSFKGSGGPYVYQKVPSLVALAMEQADSPGQYLHQNIKGQYDYSKAGNAASE